MLKLSRDDLQSSALLLGRPFAPLWSCAMRTRALWYQSGFSPTHRPPVPVISVGNLGMGGNGKTPVVQALALALRDRGRKPAVISRGYGGRATGRANVVSDGKTVLLPAREAGDEPRLLAERLPGVLVLTGRRRHLPARKAVEMGADVLILDDGFQHLALARDADLVLFNADQPLGDGRVFPGGLLRESPAALSRATGFVLTAASERNRDQREQFAARLKERFPETPVHQAAFTPEEGLMLRPDGTLAALPLSDLRKRNASGFFAFCGIARPAAFFRTLAGLGFSLKGVCALADHQDYLPQHCAELADKARQAGAGALIATEKDLVKLAPLASRFAGLSSPPLYSLRMRAVLPEALVEEMLRIVEGGGIIA